MRNTLEGSWMHVKSVKPLKEVPLLSHDGVLNTFTVLGMNSFL